jgi:uncharacterized damage-inducible protein DinB
MSGCWKNAGHWGMGTIAECTGCRLGAFNRLLNHVLPGDRIRMARFEGGGRVTPALDTVLFEDFGALQAARTAED